MVFFSLSIRPGKFPSLMKDVYYGYILPDIGDKCPKYQKALHPIEQDNYRKIFIVIARWLIP